MKKVLYLIAVQVLLTFGSCTRHCAGFSNEMRLQYFPYSKGQELAFINDARDTLLFHVTNVRNDGPYNLAWNVKEDCMPTMRVDMAANINAVDVSAAFIFIAVYADGEGDEDNWMPTDKGTWYMPFVHSKVSGGSTDAHYHFLEGEGINEFLCSLMDTLHFSCDTNYYSEPHLDSLVVVRNKGLTSFSSPDGQKYQLIDIE